MWLLSITWHWAAMRMVDWYLFVSHSIFRETSSSAVHSFSDSFFICVGMHDECGAGSDLSPLTGSLTLCQPQCLLCPIVPATAPSVSHWCSLNTSRCCYFVLLCHFYYRSGVDFIPVEHHCQCIVTVSWRNCNQSWYQNHSVQLGPWFIHFVDGPNQCLLASVTVGGI